MPQRFVSRCFLLALLVLAVRSVQPAEVTLRKTSDAPDPSRALIRIRTKERSTQVIPRFITGKFAEHLGYNIYNGMDAQILRNPTFADYPFSNGQMTPDGVTKFLVDDNRINEELRRQGTRFGWPETELDGLVKSRADALACFWTRLGNPLSVLVSADTGPFGGRAQRIQVKEAGQGIAQWTWLPLHRQRKYELEIMARSPDLKALIVSIGAQGQDMAVTTVRLDGLSSQWSKLHGVVEIPRELPSDRAYRISVTAEEPGQFVLRHAILRPFDHIDGADPDIVRLLRSSHLPLLRWPGGNFVSTYHWRDGVGPMEQRPTLPNLAWGAIEPNTFGTDEFIQFCRNVGCEPFICINAGSGSPSEAAQWIEYCNGPADSAMGRLRAAHGHPEPFRVQHWEVGNELWGHWQMNWTTAAGYVDRYQAFSRAMLAADPNIRLYACGAPAMSDKHWNATVIDGVGGTLVTMTDHPLIGGTVSPAASPLDVFRDFMAVPEVLQGKWMQLRDAMRAGGIAEPHLAVTELQLFAHLGRNTQSNAPVRMTYETLPSQGSITEALYDILIYHAAIRLAPFVEMITHSAVVNHGGGLRKERERVWANPCHYAQAAFAAFGEATPLPVEIESGSEQAPMVLPDLKNAARTVAYGAVDALAARAKDGSILLSLVHRGSAGPIKVSISVDDFNPSQEAQVQTLSAATCWEGNSLAHPDQVHPADSLLAFQEGKAELEMKPFSSVRLRLPPQ